MSKEHPFYRLQHNTTFADHGSQSTFTIVTWWSAILIANLTPSNYQDVSIIIESVYINIRICATANRRCLQEALLQSRIQPTISTAGHHWRRPWRSHLQWTKCWSGSHNFCSTKIRLVPPDMKNTRPGKKYYSELSAMFAHIQPKLKLCECQHSCKHQNTITFAFEA